MGLEYLRGDENVIYGAPVTTTAGADDAAHDNDWLTDGRNRPARGTSGTVTWEAVAAVAGEIGVAVVHSHTIDALRAVAIAGDVVGAGSGPAARPHGIPVDIWIPTTVATGDTVSVGVAGNTVALVVAELLAGKRRELASDFSIHATEIGYLPIGQVRRQSPGGSVTGFWRGLDARYLRGDIVVTKAERDDIMAWYEGSLGNVRMSAIKPFADSDEAWTVSFSAMPTFRSQDGAWVATLAFEEWARKGWLL